MTARDGDEERVHALFKPLRDQVVTVSVEFGRRVADGIEHFLSQRDLRAPSLLDVLGGMVVESINIATSAVEDDPEEDEDER